MDTFNPITLTLSYMNKAEKFKALTGPQKKIFVIDAMKNVIIPLYGEEYWIECKPRIEDIIETFIFATNHRVEINTRLKKWASCCSI